MQDHSIKRDGIAFVIVILLLILGLIAVWISKTNFMICQTSNDLYYATLIVAPILIYAIASGRIKQLKAGGLEAEFGDIANRPIEPSPIQTEDVTLTQKSSTHDLESKMKELERQFILGNQKIKPIILTLCLKDISEYEGNNHEEWRRYSKKQLMKYIEELSVFKSLVLVVILDENNKVRAYIPSDKLIIRFYRSIGNIDPGNDFIRAINDRELERIVRIPEVITTVIKRDYTNIDALRIMLKQGIDILVVVDDNEFPIGIVQQEQLLTKLLTKVILDIE